MDFTIRAGEKKDFPKILDYIKELADFENALENVSNSIEKMEDESQYFRTFVVENQEGEVIAFALYFFAYFTWIGKSLYLDDLYIDKKYRRMGIGSALINKIMEVAKAENCKRVRWQVLDWNVDAIELYKKAKARLDYEWVNCDYDEEGIKNYKNI